MTANHITAGVCGAAAMSDTSVWHISTSYSTAVLHVRDKSVIFLYRMPAFVRLRLHWVVQVCMPRANPSFADFYEYVQLVHVFWWHCLLRRFFAFCLCTACAMQSRRTYKCCDSNRCSILKPKVVNKSMVCAPFLADVVLTAFLCSCRQLPRSRCKDRHGVGRQARKKDEAPHLQQLQ